MLKKRFKLILKSRVFIGVICFILGGIFLSSSTDTKELDETVATLSQDLELKEKEISELKGKIEEAKPWFEMKEEERKAESERLEKEKAQKEAEEKAESERLEKEKVQKEAEEKAKEEEEARLAAEKKSQEEEAARLAEAEKYNTGLTYEDLARNPIDNIGKFVEFSGTIIQVMNSDDYVQYRMAINDDYNKVVLIEINKDKLTSGNVLEDDYITIEGTFVMEMEYETVLGASQSIPAIVVDNFYR